MKLILKICLVAVIWAFGIYRASVACSDPAGQGWAELLAWVFALILSIPVAIGIARTPLAETVRYRKLRRILLCVPLAVATSPLVVMVAAVAVAILLQVLVHPVTLALLLLAAVFWGVRMFRRKMAIKKATALPAIEKRRKPPRLPALHTCRVTSELRRADPPRTRKPVFGIAAWVLPPASVPVCILLFLLYMAIGKDDIDGYEVWSVFALALIPLIIALCIAPILAITALCRRERIPSVPTAFLILYVVVVGFIALG